LSEFHGMRAIRGQLEETRKKVFLHQSKSNRLRARCGKLTVSLSDGMRAFGRGLTKLLAAPLLFSSPDEISYSWAHCTVHKPLSQLLHILDILGRDVSFSGRAITAAEKFPTLDVPATSILAKYHFRLQVLHKSMPRSLFLILFSLKVLKKIGTMPVRAVTR
jgi:hypothetical protein